MASYQFRPLSFGEILDGAFGIYRHIFGVLISIAVICQAIPAVLSVYQQLSGGVIFNPGLWLLSTVLGALLGLLAAGATLHAISERYLGHEPTVDGALRYALKKMWRLFVAGVGKYIIVVLATLALIVPGIIVACGYAVVAQVAVLEELRAPTDALGRSWFLTKGFKGRAFGLYVVVYVLLYIPFVAAGVLALAMPDLVTRPGVVTGVTVFSQILWLLIYPLFNCVFTLFYYDLRVRKEAFDLEYLSQQLDVGASSV